MKEHKHDFILYDDEKFVFKNQAIKKEPILLCIDCETLREPTLKELDYYRKL
jgi:hypothetical protein